MRALAWVDSRRENQYLETVSHGTALQGVPDEKPHVAIPHCRERNHALGSCPR
jgi:hypothetical protein